MTIPGPEFLADVDPLGLAAGTVSGWGTDPFSPVAPEYQPDRMRPGFRPAIPGEYEQRRPSAVPAEEMGDPDLDPPPRRLPDPDPAGKP